MSKALGICISKAVQIATPGLTLQEITPPLRHMPNHSINHLNGAWGWLVASVSLWDIRIWTTNIIEFTSQCTKKAGQQPFCLLWFFNGSSASFHQGIFNPPAASEFIIIQIPGTPPLFSIEQASIML